MTAEVIDISSYRSANISSLETFEQLLTEKLNETFVLLRTEATEKKRIYPGTTYSLIGRWTEIECGLYCFLPVIAKHLRQSKDDQLALPPGWNDLNSEFTRPLRKIEMMQPTLEQKLRRASHQFEHTLVGLVQPGQPQDAIELIVPSWGKMLVGDCRSRVVSNVVSARKELRSENLEIADLFPKVVLVPQVPTDQPAYF